MVFAQVKDKRISMSHEVHRGDHRGSADIRIRETSKFHVANIVRKNLDLRESTVVVLKHGAETGLIGRTWLMGSRRRTRRIRYDVRVIADEQMLIVADSLQIAAESLGELIAINNRVVVTVLFVIAHSLNHVRGH